MDTILDNLEPMVHIGKKIEEIVRKKRVNVSELALKINKSRPVIYDIFERESIDTGLLIRLSEILDYDFLREYLNQNVLREEPEEYKKTRTEVERLRQQLQLKDLELENARKEIDYLKKINRLLEEAVEKSRSGIVKEST
jgi:hypothetical protein